LFPLRHEAVTPRFYDAVDLNGNAAPEISMYAKSREHKKSAAGASGRLFQSAHTVPKNFFSHFYLLLRQGLMAASLFMTVITAIASEPNAHATPVETLFSDALRPLPVAAYRVKGDPVLTNSAFASVLDVYIGTNMTLLDVVRAASKLQLQYLRAGYTNVTITIGRHEITNSVVTMNTFRGSLPQVVIDGRRCAPVELEDLAAVPRTPTTNAPAETQASSRSRAASSTNAPPGFLVRAYEIAGDTLLTESTLTGIMQKYTGTNITVPDIVKAGSEMQMEYRKRGYPTVNVTIPPQKLDSNAIVKLKVLEGRLAEVNVVNNHYFSSNNVMRALPSLHTNMILVEPVLQAELDRANANQDRQIYPQIEPGPTPGTSALDLKVKDRLPLHAKMEFNNQNSPSTPELRLNASATYDNLWQLEHSLGVQYSFSPENYKVGDRWDFYDEPQVANYSAFYRLPLGNAGAVEDVINSQPGSFGFSEATRQFRLPAPSGRSELNFFASRSTIDTGLEQLENRIIYDIPGVRQVRRQDVQQDITLNEDLGFRLSQPVRGTDRFRSTFSGGLDYKTYSLTSAKTNIFSFTEITLGADGRPNPPIVSTVPSPVPTTHLPLNYVPILLRYDGSLRDKLGTTSFGLGLTVNTWYSGSSANLESITGSHQSSGTWVVLMPSVSRDLFIRTNWVLTLRADGQWANEPLISTERFGAGGVNSIRGYHEGEIFGDTGWRIGAEQKTPPHIIGIAYDRTPMTIRGAIFMDYAETYLLDASEGPSRVPLWGTGFGGVLSVGTHWEARLLFSWPLLTAGTTEAYAPHLNFSLSSQF
jgi:hemolysin activation/secretion protein